MMKNCTRILSVLLCLVYMPLSAESACDRAPRDDLSLEMIAPCNPCTTDLEAIAETLCEIRGDISIIESLIETIIEVADPCAPLPLTQADMPAVLAIDDQAYCVTEELFGDITINGDDVTINLDEHTVNGRILINGERAIVRGGKVVGVAPASNGLADAGVVALASTAVNTQLLDLYVSAQDGTVAGVRGARAINFLNAPDLIIRNCVVVGGKGGPLNGISAGGTAIQGGGDRFLLENSQVRGGAGSDSDSGSIRTGSGAQGLNITGGSLCTIITCTVQGGNAGSMNTDDDVGGVSLGFGGSNTINTRVLMMQESTVFGGNAGSVTTTGDIGVGGVVSGGGGSTALTLLVFSGLSNFSTIIDSEFVGGDGVQLTADSIGVSGTVTLSPVATGVVVSSFVTTLFDNCAVKGGSRPSFIAGNIGVGAAVTENAAGNGLDVINGAVVEASNSLFVGGDVGDILITGLTGGLATSANVVQGNAGRGVLVGGKATFNACQCQGGSIGTGIGISVSGSIGSATTSLTAGSAGPACVVAGVTDVVLDRCTLSGGNYNGTIRTNNGGNTIDNVIGGSSGHGLQILSDSVVVRDCQIKGGTTGNIREFGGSTIGSLAPVSGVNAGNGILVEAFVNTLTVLNTVITTFDGGSVLGGAGGAFARTGGNGGVGINLNAAGITGVIIDGCTINQTGDGGNVTAGGLGTGGNGGDGIFVSDDVISAELSKNTIGYTGVAGTGDVAGTAGQAINSLSTSAGPSPAPTMFIYGNYAHDIANAVPYNIVAGNIDGFPTGTAYTTAAGTNFLFNIFR